MIKMAACLAVSAALALLSGELAAESARVNVYRYTPCKSELHGNMQIKHVTLNDPKLKFTAFILVLDKPISVANSDSYEAVSGERRIQLQFENDIKIPSPGSCVDVVGELAGAETASDIYPLIMRVDSYSRCK